MSSVKNWVRSMEMFLPVQLLLIQLRHYKFLLLFWLLVLGLSYGFIAHEMGGSYLFVEPEYLGKENFWPSFIVGSALGAFLFAYTITLYINASYRFHFIAQMRNPFFTLAYNNFIIPGTFLALYFGHFIQFQISSQGEFNLLVLEKVLGLVLGICTVFLISASYFFAQRSLIHRFGSKLADTIPNGNNPKNNWVIIGKARKSMKAGQKANRFLVFPFRVISTAEWGSIPEFREVVKTLSQHHRKLLLLQILTFLFIAFLGLASENPFFQIPAGASFLLVFSLCLLVFGAVTFWFRKVGMAVAASLVILILAYTRFGIFKVEHHVRGLDYTQAAVCYEDDTKSAITQEEFIQADKAYTLQMLNNWKADYQEKYGKYAKPRAVFVTASGGGLRSALWTLTVLQQLDSLSEGGITEEMRLMTGASGGMFGLTYFREIYMRSLSEDQINLRDTQYRDNISKDLLNSIFFKQYTEVLLPNQRKEVEGQWIQKDAGYSFDQQLRKNLPEFADRKLGDYVSWEQSGQIPQVIITPTIINEGRKLYVSSSPVSYLSRPNKVTDRYETRAKGIEFRRLFENHQPDELHMVSALRMNASFPYVLPIVELPSEPIMKVMDAGALDNFGTQTAVKYLYEFKDWFAKNTRSVLFIQIRDTHRKALISDVANDNVINQMLLPLGSGYASMLEGKDISNDYLMEFIGEWYDGKVEVIPFEYPREMMQTPASLSFHLTQKEKESIEKSLGLSNNSQGLATVKSLYSTKLLAQRRK
ncbi:MAG: patatin-like phospholipase family protein [Bacteroidota bacterium]